MNILVTAATAAELKPFLHRLNEGPFPAADIDVLITGIGLTATTWSLTKQFSIRKPDLVVQAGVAGCFDRNIPLGTVVAVKKDALADQGVVEKGTLKTMFDLGLVPSNQYPFKKGWLVNNSEVLKKIRLRKVTGISVNEITTSRQKVKQYEQQFQPVTESMEGAALHYVCLMEQIPFVQIRAVSNYITERNKKNWNLKESITNLNQALWQALTVIAAGK